MCFLCRTILRLLGRCHIKATTVLMQPPYNIPTPPHPPPKQKCGGGGGREPHLDMRMIWQHQFECHLCLYVTSICVWGMINIRQQTSKLICLGYQEHQTKYNHSSQMNILTVFSHPFIPNPIINCVWCRNLLANCFLLQSQINDI